MAAAAPDARADEAPTLEVLRAVDGWFGLERRSPTLDGSLPLRVVQGCQPMLDGTALGVQAVLQVPLRLRRSWGSWRVDALPGDRRVERWGIETDPALGARELERAESQRRAVVPALFAQGALDARWRSLVDGPVARIVRTRTTSHLRLWTGLLARVPEGARLVALRASPVRTAGVDLRPAVIPAHGAWAPLTLDLALDPRADELIVGGSVATLAVLPPRVPLRVASLREAPEAARALLDFYDARYFAAKREGEVTRKYRRLVADAPEAVEPGAVTVVEGGPREIEADAIGDEADAPTALSLRAAVAMDARYDGQRAWVDMDPAALDRRRRAIEDAWAFLARPDDPAHRGALWYLTKYATPHPPGEPHFFVKPCAMVVTPPGWSTLVEGVGVPGVGDTLRGFVHTDRFHAVPAVFSLPVSARAGRVSAGSLLARLFPLPRAWAAPVVREARFEVR